MSMSRMRARWHEPKRYGNGKGDSAEGKDCYARRRWIRNQQKEGRQTDSGHGVAKKTKDWLAEVGCVADL